MKNIVKLQEDANIFKVIISLMIILLSDTGVGISSGFSATAAVAYASANTTTYFNITLPDPLNEDQISWLVSAPTFSCTVCILLSGFVSEFLGRKKALLYGHFQILAGCTMLLIYATNFANILIARILMGCGVGTLFPITYMYSSEIALIRFRGTAAVMNSFVRDAAWVFSLILSATLKLDGVLLMSCLPSVLFILTSYFLPESPIWLMKRNQVEKAEQIMIELRGPHYPMESELEEMKTILKSQESSKPGMGSKWHELKSRTTIVPVLMMTVFMMLQAMSGQLTLSYYSLHIFKRANVTMNSHVLAILVACGLTMSCAISAFLMSRVPRKIHFISSGLVMAVSTITLGFILHQGESSNETWNDISDVLLPICCICISIGYGLGVGPVLFSYLGEIFPQKIKSTACSIILSLRNMTAFTLLKIYPSLINKLGLHGIFLFHGAICILVSVLAGIFLPETEGKTMTQLENLYKKKSDVPVQKSFTNNDLHKINEKFHSILVNGLKEHHKMFTPVFLELAKRLEEEKINIQNEIQVPAEAPL